MKQSNISISLAFISASLTSLFFYLFIKFSIYSTQYYTGQDDSKLYSFQFIFLFISFICLILTVLCVNSILFFYQLSLKQLKKERIKERDIYLKGLIFELKYEKLERDLKITNVIENKKTIIEEFYKNLNKDKVEQVKSYLSERLNKIFKDTKKDLDDKARMSTENAKVDIENA